EDRGNDVDCRSDGPEAGNEQRDGPVVRTVTGRKRTRGQRSIGPPSHVGCISRAIEPASAEKAEVEKKSSESRQPETEGIQAWKGHVPSADHQRHQVVGKAEQHRYAYEENHGRAMHGEHAVEDLWRNNVVMWIHQLRAHDHGFRPGDAKKKQGIEEVQNTQSLVINRGYPPMQRFDPRTNRDVFGLMNGHYVR